ncbi:unnamed protein product [Tetraodon nigroviridis]|uniref:(spotted green pufferfish) hypothetical protein n=1 Tax=Tetraodon nigroviridis TaxID=99883 RepID=Q4TD46_TETNG|nr:unnamed protein product [Tetraodon nigroviridis]
MATSGRRTSTQMAEKRTWCHSTCSNCTSDTTGSTDLKRGTPSGVLGQIKV